MQVELLRTVKKYIVSAEELFPIALAVACDASEACRSYGETVLKKRCGVDGAHPDLDADNEAFITHQLRWFLGDSEDIPEEIRVQPASDEIRSNILRRVLSRSQRSANLFPQNVEIVSSSLNNPRSKQLRASGMEFSAWVLRNAEKDILEKAAPKLLGDVFDNSRYFRNLLTGYYDDIGTNPRHGIERFLFSIARASH